MSSPESPAVTLSADGMVMRVTRKVAGGTRTATYTRQPGSGPFTDADVQLTLRLTPLAEAGAVMIPGQRSWTRRTVTRFGTLWTHVMTGPPTWWLPKLQRRWDGTLMAGWLRLAVAVKFDRHGDEEGAA
jgi:hypothetical protein